MRLADFTTKMNSNKLFLSRIPCSIVVIPGGQPSLLRGTAMANLSSRRAAGDALAAVATSLQMMAAAVGESNRLLDGLQPEDEGYGNANNESDMFFAMGVGMYTLSLSLSAGSRRRGPYDQIAKCTEFFRTALSWPDKEFRHSFRYVH